MPETANEENRPGRKHFLSCQHIAETILFYLSVENALKCMEVYPEWELAVNSCRTLIAGAKKIHLWLRTVT